MCQMGAIGMAEAGKSKKDILTHYYTGVRLHRLY
jgi:SpoIID/LytB domain protein